MSGAPKPRWLVNYENVDVSDEVGPMVISGEYVDHLEGKSDELKLTLEDTDGRWREGWWPSKGDAIAVKMGLEGESLLDAGRFQVDEVELRGSPDTVSISALSAPQTGALRTRQHRAFENVTLLEVAADIAAELDLEIMGDIEALFLTRVTQAGETTLAFLRRLSESYGYAFSIRPPNLVFFKIAELESAPPVITIDRSSSQLLNGWTLKGAVQDTYVACEVSWLDPETKITRKVRVEAAHARSAVIVGSASQEQSEPLPLPTRTLRQGSSGDDVRNWQTFLASRGHYQAEIDGLFGPITRAATIAFQRERGIGVDGVAGPETYRAAVEAGYSSTDARVTPEVSGRVLRIEQRVESLEQAEALARAKLAAANRLRVTGTLPLMGDRRVVAGATIELTGMGRLSGRYLVQESRHRVGRSGGYTVSAEVTFV